MCVGGGGVEGKGEGRGKEGGRKGVGGIGVKAVGRV